MTSRAKGAIAALVFFAVATLLSWLLLYTGIWALVVAAGVAAGILIGGKYLQSFALGIAGGVVSSVVWLFPALSPGASGYVNAIGALASIPGYLLLTMSLVITALFVGSGGVIGVWMRRLARPEKQVR